jgi:hypothetical protein
MLREWFKMTNMSAGTLVLLSLIGCASSQTTGGVVPTTQPTSASPVSPSVAGIRVLLLPIADGGNSEDGVAPGSGAAMTAELRDKLLLRGMSPLVTEATSLQAAIEQARSLGYEFVIKALFIDWQDNATEWSARPDRAAVSAELYDVKTATLLATATDREKGSAMSFVSQDPSRFYPAISNAVLTKFIPPMLSHRTTLSNQQ